MVKHLEESKEIQKQTLRHTKDIAQNNLGVGGGESYA